MKRPELHLLRSLQLYQVAVLREEKASDKRETSDTRGTSNQSDFNSGDSEDDLGTKDPSSEECCEILETGDSIQEFDNTRVESLYLDSVDDSGAHVELDGVETYLEEGSKFELNGRSYELHEALETEDAVKYREVGC